MIVDTSALMAVARGEPGHEPMLAALLREPGVIPSPVLVEFHRVAARFGNRLDADDEGLIEDLLAGPIRVEPLSEVAARAAVAANPRFGSGNGHGGKLNLLDLMVYGAAVTSGRPILCTGRDFAATDAEIHPASRLG
ncbi:MAG: type II toxin-antitoxin system VapC family toxin [Alphaproteobacteria bacterium]|nr:type II toxin-antitoxin system VapC family toxin [Alphaproteobacteria bacterium]